MRSFSTGQDRGSRRRWKRITLRGTWSLELLLFIVWLLFCLLVIVPWLARHPRDAGRPGFESQPVQSVR